MRIAIAVVLLSAGGAFGGERFGDRGTVSPSGSVSLGFWGSGSSGSGLAPGAMVFVADGLSVGGSALLFYSSGSGFSYATFGIAPSVGLNLWVRDRLSFFPQVSLQATQRQFTSGGDLTQRELAINVYLPLLLHVTPHFFIGLGPSASIPVASRTTGNSTSGLTFGTGGNFVLLNSVIGGWF